MAAPTESASGMRCCAGVPSGLPPGKRKSPLSEVAIHNRCCRSNRITEIWWYGVSGPPKCCERAPSESSPA
jgi:hypothetical protein